MNDTGLKPENLVLEITESTIMKDNEDIVFLLEQLNAMGISLALDDFGTGYSSLSYLTRFPISILKIDASFIRNIGKNKRSQDLVEAMIALAKKLQLKVIAEGVETQEQKAFLSDQECDQIRGYYISKPLSTVHFEQQILKHRGQGIPLTSNVSQLRQKGQI